MPCLSKCFNNNTGLETGMEGIHAVQHGQKKLCGEEELEAKLSNFKLSSLVVAPEHWQIHSKETVGRRVTPDAPSLSIIHTGLRRDLEIRATLCWALFQSQKPRKEALPHSKEQPTPVFLPGKSHGQRNLVGCSPRGHKKSDRTEGLTLFSELLKS